MVAVTPGATETVGAVRLAAPTPLAAIVAALVNTTEAADALAVNVAVAFAMPKMALFPSAHVLVSPALFHASASLQLTPLPFHV